VTVPKVDSDDAYGKQGTARTGFPTQISKESDSGIFFISKRSRREMNEMKLKAAALEAKNAAASALLIVLIFALSSRLSGPVSSMGLRPHDYTGGHMRSDVQTIRPPLSQHRPELYS
jgi:hypothetical protein